MRSRWRLGRWAVIVFVVIWSLFPIYWALNTSLMAESDAYSTPAHWYPKPLDSSNYHKVFSSDQMGYWPQFSRALINSVIECGAATILTLAVAIFSSYAFARLEFRFKRALFYIVITTLSLPAYATLIPLYRMMSQAGLVNTYTGVVLVYVSGFLPLAVWILYNYFQTIPQALEEAASIDGASTWTVLFRVVLPIAGPGITSAAIICFLTAWGQFLFPLVLSSDDAAAPLTVFLTQLKGRFIIPYTLMNAVGVLSIVVPAAIVIFMNRYIIKGMIAGSVK